ncbi:hypothetical protein O1Q81_01647 [Lonepinella sp. MS14436]
METEYRYIDIEAVENGTGKFSIEQSIIGKNLPSRARRLAKTGSTIISTVRPNLKGFAYVEKEIENGIFSTGFAILNSKNTDVLLDKMVFYTFMYSKNMMQQMEHAMPKGQYPSINKTDIENFMFTVMPIETQQSIVAQISEYEDKIREAEQVIASTAEKKKGILEKYL